jgi:hypothetical protein
MFNLSWKYWQHLHITFYRTWSCEHAIFISITLISGVSQSPTGIVNVVQRGLYISTLYLVINHTTDVNKIFSVSYYRNWSCAPVSIFYVLHKDLHEFTTFTKGKLTKSGSNCLIYSPPTKDTFISTSQTGCGLHTSMTFYSIKCVFITAPSPS